MRARKSRNAHNACKRKNRCCREQKSFNPLWDKGFKEEQAHAARKVVDKMREREIEKKLVIETKARGGMAAKFTSPGMNGMPDRLVLMPGGRMGFVELKAPGKKPRLVQELRMRQLRRLGFKAYVIDGTEQIDYVLRRIGGGDAL